MNSLEGNAHQCNGETDARLVHKRPHTGIDAFAPLARVVFIPLDNVGAYGSRKHPKPYVEETGEKHDYCDRVMRGSGHEHHG